MYDGNEVPEALLAIASNRDRSQTWEVGGKDARYFQKLRRLLAKMNSKTGNCSCTRSRKWRTVTHYEAAKPRACP
jgi:hypothetical protein